MESKKFVRIRSFVTLKDRLLGKQEDVYEERIVYTSKDLESAVEAMKTVAGSGMYLEYSNEQGEVFRVTGFGEGPYENALKYLNT